MGIIKRRDKPTHLWANSQSQPIVRGAWVRTSR